MKICGMLRIEINSRDAELLDQEEKIKDLIDKISLLIDRYSQLEVEKDGLLNKLTEIGQLL